MSRRVDAAAASAARSVGRPRRVSDEEIYWATVLSLADRGGTFSLADVAARVGVTAAAIRQRYGSRRGLVLAVASARVAHTAARFESARASHRSAIEALQAALVAELGMVERPEQVAHVFSAYTELTSDPEVAAIFGEEIRAMVRETERLLREAADAHELAVPVTHDLARAVVALAEGTMLLWALAPDGDVAARVRTAVRTLLGCATDG